MENEQGFYKNDNGTLLFGPNFVMNKEYELKKENKDEYNYPVFGWYWFDVRQEALDFFGIVEDTEQQETQI